MSTSFFTVHARADRQGSANRASNLVVLYLGIAWASSSSVCSSQRITPPTHQKVQGALTPLLLLCHVWQVFVPQRSRDALTSPCCFIGLVLALTTNHGRTRFNPNVSAWYCSGLSCSRSAIASYLPLLVLLSSLQIYAGGKVCLSILGTWRGTAGEQCKDRPVGLDSFCSSCSQANTFFVRL